MTFAPSRLSTWSIWVWYSGSATPILPRAEPEALGASGAAGGADDLRGSRRSAISRAVGMLTGSGLAVDETRAWASMALVKLEAWMTWEPSPSPVATAIISRR